MIQPQYVTGEAAIRLQDLGINDSIEDKQYNPNPIYELWVVQEWLRVNYGIWVCARYVFKQYTPVIATDWNYKTDEQIKDALKFMLCIYTDPSEATKEAIIYTIKNLI